MGPIAPKLCPRCRRDTLPQLAQPSWHREKHRATQAERGVDPKAEQAKRRKARRKEKAALRKQLRAEGIIATARAFFTIRGVPHPLTNTVPSEECPECLKLQAETNVKSAAA